MPTDRLSEPWDVAAEVPHLDEYFGIWAIQEEPFRAAVARVNGLDLQVHVRAQKAAGPPQAAAANRDYQPAGDGVAVINLSGPMQKYVSSLSGGTSTVAVRRALRTAVRDETVRSILLRIDSPGGTVSGTRDLADDVAAAAAEKPVHAYIEDLGASAAYWVASQATKVYANPTAMVGSIGTFAVIYDFSAQASMIGVKVHVLRAGDFKGAGQPGTEVTAEQLAEWQRIVNELNEHFIRGVSAGRKLSLGATRALADGRVHIGQAAADLNLIDGVQTFDATLLALSKPSARRNTVTQQQQLPPAEQAATPPPVPQAAGYEDLKAACPGADSDFLCSQLDGKATLDQARTAWMQEQNRRIEAAEEETRQAQAAAGKPGVEALGGGDAAPKPAAGFEGDPVAEFNRQVREKVRGGMSRRAAVKAVARDDNEFHRAYLEQTNPQHRKVQDLIGERFELAK